MHAPGKTRAFHFVLSCFFMVNGKTVKSLALSQPRRRMALPFLEQKEVGLSGFGLPGAEERRPCRAGQ